MLALKAERDAGQEDDIFAEWCVINLVLAGPRPGGRSANYAELHITLIHERPADEPEICTTLIPVNPMLECHVDQDGRMHNAVHIAVN